MIAQEILNKAKSEGYALGAFNAGNLELVKAVVEAAKTQQSPVIIETSAGEIQHFGMKNFLDVVENFRQETGLTILTMVLVWKNANKRLRLVSAWFILMVQNCLMKRMSKSLRR